MIKTNTPFRTLLAAGLLSTVLTVPTVFTAAGSARADAPATQPSDAPEVKAIRDQLLDWDKKAPTMSLEETRKEFHSDNDKEARYLDFMAHESWEAAKTQQAVRDKWGAEAETRFAHLLGSSTAEDDQVCTIKVDGDHATVSWDNIKNSSPVAMIKVDGHWFADGHALYAQATADNPNQEPEQHPMGKVMKQAREDLTAGKFDDADAFIADFKSKIGADGN
jgi:hypothetical protein